MIRISTLLRVVEDGVVGSAKAIGRGAKKSTRAVRLEYNARVIDKLQRRVQTEFAVLNSMSDAQRELMARQEAVVFARVEELRAERAAKAAAKIARLQAQL